MNIKQYIIIIFSFSLISCSTSKQRSVNKNYDKSIERAKDYLEYYSDESISNKSEYHYINGLTEQQKGNWAESLIDFNQALKSDSSAAILYSMSKSYYQLNRIDLTLEVLLRSMAIQEDFVPSMELLSQIYIRLNDVSNAISINEKIIEIDPSYSRKIELAELYEINQPEKAIEIYTELYEESKDSYALRKLTELYSNNKGSESYVNLMVELYKSNKASFENGYQLLELYLRQDKFEKCIELLEMADSNMATEKLKILYGTAGFEMLREDNLSVDIRKKIISKIDNRFYFDWQIQIMTGYLQASLNNYDKAVDRFNNAITLKDSIPDLYLEVGSFLLSKNKMEYAEDIFQAARTKFPRMAEFPYFLGLSIEENSKEQSIELYKNSITVDPEFIPALIQLGLIYDIQNNIDSSYYFYTKALKVDPDNALASNNLAYTLSERGIKLDEALELSTVALKSDPQNPVYLDTYGWVLYKKGEYSAALKYISNAIDIGGASAEVFEHYGDILKAMDRNKEAANAYKKALELEPERQSAIDNLKQLE